MKMLTKAAFAVALSASTIPLQAAEAATIVYNLAGTQTFTVRGNAANTVAFLNLGAGAHVTGLVYNVTVATIGASWRSEAGIAYTDSPITDGVLFTPGFADTSSGTSTYSGTSDLVALGLDFFVGANGLLRLEFYDSYDDNVNAADANLSGLLTFQYSPATAVPEPATWAMMLIGFGLMGATMRYRRRSTRIVYA